MCLRALDHGLAAGDDGQRLMPGIAEGRCAVSMFGSATVTTTLSGPPAATTASLMRVTALRYALGRRMRREDDRVAGSDHADRVVDDGRRGLVDGVTEAITPHAAFSIRVSPRSPGEHRGDRHSMPGVARACREFLAILSSAAHPGFGDGQFGQFAHTRRRARRIVSTQVRPHGDRLAVFCA